MASIFKNLRKRSTPIRGGKGVITGWNEKSGHMVKKTRRTGEDVSSHEYMSYRGAKIYRSTSENWQGKRIHKFHAVFYSGDKRHSKIVNTLADAKKFIDGFILKHGKVSF